MTGLYIVPVCTACYPLSAWVLSPCIASLDSNRVRASTLERLFPRHQLATRIMATALLPTGGIALLGAPDSDRDARSMSVQAMQLNMSQEIVDELLESVRSGKSPQIFFGRTPVCLQSLCETCEAVSGWRCGSAAWWSDSACEEGTTWLTTHNSNSSTATRPTRFKVAPRAIDMNCTNPAGLATTLTSTSRVWSTTV